MAVTAFTDIPVSYCMTYYYMHISFSSHSSGLWSPIDIANSPNFHSANSFSAFGPNNSFNLTGGNPVYEKTHKCRGTGFSVDWLHSDCVCVSLVFSGMNLPKPSEPQQSWPEFTSASSIWDMTSSDPLHSWPSSSSSPTAPTAVRAIVWF